MGPDLEGALLEPIQALLGPAGADRRVYLPFVVTSIALAALAWRVTKTPGFAGRARRAPLLRWLLPRRIFFHRSSLFDARWLVVRGLAHALLSWPLTVTVVGTMLWVTGHLRGAIGMPSWESPKERAGVIAAFTLATFLADDLTRFLLHWTMHRVPALWELHKVHHSADVLTPITLYRVHPIESVANRLRGVLTLGVVTGIFAWAVPGQIKGWEILGVDAIGFVWAALGSNLRHSHVWLTWTRPLEHVFVSPAQHQIHHGRGRESWDKNFGSTLALWDWLFGTLAIAHGARPPRVGLDRAERNHRLTARSALVDPVIASLRALARPFWVRGSGRGKREGAAAARRARVAPRRIVQGFRADRTRKFHAPGRGKANGRTPSRG